MDQQQEREIAKGLREGRTDAWRALYDAYARPVWDQVARRMGTDAAAVADVVQETFLAAARSAGRFDPARGSLWLWLSGIARRHVALHYRKRRRQLRLTAGSDWEAGRQQVIAWLENRHDPPSAALESAELAEHVRAALSDLSVEHETLLTARYLDGVSVEEIAGQENCTPVAVRSRLARARRAFREAFRKIEPTSAIS